MRLASCLLLGPQLCFVWYDHVHQLKHNADSSHVVPVLLLASILLIGFDD